MVIGYDTIQAFEPWKETGTQVAKPHKTAGGKASPQFCDASRREALEEHDLDIRSGALKRGLGNCRAAYAIGVDVGYYAYEG